MRNITISVEDQVLVLLKKKAAAAGVSVNRYLRELIGREVTARRDGEQDEFFRLVDEYKPNSHGRKWSREEIYEDALKGLL